MSMTTLASVESIKIIIIYLHQIAAKTTYMLTITLMKMMKTERCRHDDVGEEG